MAIGIGDRLPQANFKIMTDDGPANVTSEEIFSGKKIVLFAVPGAYTPTCHGQHVPGFLENFDALKSKGIDEIVCVAVNDVFVLKHWGKDTGGEGKIRFLSDGNNEFTKAIGLDFDASAAGLGIRSKRYAMIVDDGVVKFLSVEEVPSQVAVSSAEDVLKAL